MLQNLKKSLEKLADKTELDDDSIDEWETDHENEFNQRRRSGPSGIQDNSSKFYFSFSFTYQVFTYIFQIIYFILEIYFIVK